MNAVLNTVRDACTDAPPASPIWADWLQPAHCQALVQHPLLQALAGPGNNLGLLKAVLAQHSHYSRHFTRYLVALMGRLEDPADVLVLLHNLGEEMGVDAVAGTDTGTAATTTVSASAGVALTHAELFQRTLARVGVLPAEHAVLPATRALVAAMMAHCQSGDALAGLAALCLGAEAIVPLVYRPILASLEQLGFGEDATEFFIIHIAEDEDHALAMLAMMRRIVHGAPARMVQAVEIGRQMIGLRVAMFDAVWAACQAGCEARAPAARAHFSSGDFGQVPSRLSVRLPERLKHAQVMHTSGAADQDFSQARRHKVHIVDVPSHTISMTIGRLDVAEATRLHRHNYETVIYVLRGKGRSRVGDRQVEWQAGDAFYVPVWAEHQHENTGDEECAYLACENAPLLQNLGGIALREELGRHA